MRMYRALLVDVSAIVSARDYGAAMEETFARRMVDARALVLLAVATVWLRELGGRLASAPGLRSLVGSGGRGRQRQLESRWKAGPMEGMALEVRQAARRLLAVRFHAGCGAHAGARDRRQRRDLRRGRAGRAQPAAVSRSDRLIKLDHRVPRVSAASVSRRCRRALLPVCRSRADTRAAAAYQSGETTITGAASPTNPVDARDAVAGARPARRAGRGPLVCGARKACRARRASRCCRTDSGCADSAATRRRRAIGDAQRPADGNCRRHAGGVRVPGCAQSTCGSPISDARGGLRPLHAHWRRPFARRRDVETAAPR